MSGPSTSFKKEYCDIASRVLAGGESLAAVCAELDISRATLYNWKAQFPDFSNALDKGLQKAQRNWESIGREGICGDIDKFGSSAWIFTMKNRFRDDYKEDSTKDKGSADSLVEKLIDRLVE